MDANYAVLQNSPVFLGVAPVDIDRLLEDLHTTTSEYLKDEIIRHLGDPLDFFPVILCGKVQATLPRNDKDQIVARFSQGDSFAEAIPLSLGACPVEIKAMETTRILHIPAKNLKCCSNPYAELVYSNLTREMSKKVVNLSLNLSLLGEPRLRKRVTMYLNSLPRREDSSVTVPYNRKEMADYLGVHSKALIRELKRMQDEELIKVDKQNITIYYDENSEYGRGW